MPITKWFIYGVEYKETEYLKRIHILKKIGFKTKTKTEYFKDRIEKHLVIENLTSVSKEELNVNDKLKGLNNFIEEGEVIHQAKQDFIKDNYDSIIPEHYREGEIDLIESWYLRYPFNEFKTGMVMYADRYFNRNKNNRVEDMEKGLYVMQRLKEYELKELEKGDEK